MQKAKIIHKNPNNKGNIARYIMLGLGILALLGGLYLLIDIAIGLILLVVGLTLINLYIRK